ncbi:YcaO-like family protein [Crossiella cryophila]|uniref:Thiazole/oxazole-forming peptide maturase SagD family component n=1 Tax=Crossiella cryophila TaxID=43355 RepID=A0A7W7CFX5_9PSEU|nr:YcaO-like family protein [Crossiella cryophila]MBB4680444.1 thiazole/oxazole-forming peptide maturase SagD family component [Crossiella cryophila]
MPPTIPDVHIGVDPGQRVAALHRRMHGSLCGLTQAMSFMYGPRSGPRVMCAGGDLTGVHVLRDQPAPKPGSYHIGGYGVLPFESHIRTLGETVERYAGYVAAVSGRHPVVFRSAKEMARDGLPVLGLDAVRLFTDEQLARPGFPFQRPDPDAPLGWIEVDSLSAPGRTHVPAQLFLVGYVIRDLEGEPWLNAAVTTGTAAHTTSGAALLSALHEAVQIDAAIGHWHGATPSTRIACDGRTHALRRLLGTYWPAGARQPEFHLLPSPDLPGHVVACLLRAAPGAFPAIVVGLGVDGRLGRAMYKALLEATGVGHLAVISAVTAEGRPVDDHQHDENAIYDLESNVVRYAGADPAKTVERRFADCAQAAASDLPDDDDRPVRAQVAGLVRAFRDSGKRLYHADLTTVDIRQLGFRVSRVWSPDTLSLPLPGAPAAAHPRFAAYGGFQHHDPHPYP